MARARKTVETAPEEIETVTTENALTAPSAEVVKTRKTRTTSPLITATRAYETATAKVEKLNAKIAKQTDLTIARDVALAEATAAKEALNALL